MKHPLSKNVIFKHKNKEAAPTFAANGGAITVACGGAMTRVLHYDNGLSGDCNISGDVTSTLRTIPNACGGEVKESWDVTTACGYVK